MRGEVRAGRREVTGDGGASGMHGEGPTQGWGAGHGEERTWNMSCMFVTLDVSQLEMSASKFCEFWKRELMVVTLDVFQLEMSALKLFKLYKR